MFRIKIAENPEFTLDLSSIFCFLSAKTILLLKFSFFIESLETNEQEQLTLQEANILLALKARAKRDFFVGLGGGSLVTWLGI